jgi:hypothetical protein
MSKPNEKRVMQDALEKSVNTSSGLLNALGALMVAQIETESLELFVDSIRGLAQLAGRESENLRGRFDAFVASLEGKGGAK